MSPESCKSPFTGQGVLVKCKRQGDSPCVINTAFTRQASILDSKRRIKVALKPIQTLGHIFAKPKDRVPTDRKTHAVYSIPCGDCEKEYLGQTKRQFCTRLKEHQKAVSNLYSSKSALAHVCKTSHKIAWEDSKIITTNNRYGQRLSLEAWHINASSCALNRDDGSYLPQEYLHLVGK